jgi:transcriptional regulator with XRE-family HTH domain
MSVSRYARLVFGIKLKQLRTQRGYSFVELSERSGLSVSYLNEIENGKKYPKPEKAVALAEALDVPMEELASMDLPKPLQPLADLLHSRVFDELPLDLFGIDITRIIEIIANAPLKVSAFVSALSDISRKYEMQEESFYFAALRSYQRLFDNYFEELETEAARFRATYRLSPDEPVTHAQLLEILRKDFRYRIDKATLAFHPELRGVRSVALPDKRRLLLSPHLNPAQERFLLAKELGYRFLKLKERVYTPNMIQVTSFEEALNNFRSSYFAGALLLPGDALVKDIRELFQRSSWQVAELEALVAKYDATPELFFQRLTNLLPRFFGMNDVFLLRFHHRPGSGEFELTKELHLGRQHQPHANEAKEHYCRRWITIWLLQDLAAQSPQEARQGRPLAGLQHSSYIDSADEYLVFTMAEPGQPTPDTNLSIGLGIALTPESRAQIAFLHDRSIPHRWVHQTCERCPSLDCRQRAAPPSVLEAEERKKKMQEALDKLMS